jgi:flavin-dependent dehydrogenase
MGSAAVSHRRMKLDPILSPDRNGAIADVSFPGLLRQIVFADILVTMTSALDCDVLVAGGGPAGLAVAIAARMNGLSAIVIERQPSPPDMACGECLMPPAVSAVGDAAGYIDAITGEGLSLAFVSALTLGRILTTALALGGSRATLLAYQRESAHQFRRYAFVTKIMLAFARRPALHGPVIVMLAQYPQMFSALLHFAVGSRPARGLPENIPSLSPAESQD